MNPAVLMLSALGAGDLLLNVPEKVGLATLED